MHQNKNNKRWERIKQEAQYKQSQLTQEFASAAANGGKHLLEWIDSFVFHGQHVSEDQAQYDPNSLINILRDSGYSPSKAECSEVYTEQDADQFSKRLIEMFMADLITQGKSLPTQEQYYSKYRDTADQYEYLAHIKKIGCRGQI